MKRGSPPKKPSGAEFKKRRKDAEALARKLLAEEKASGATTSNLERYAALGAPGASALSTVLYANKAAGALLHGVMTDQTLDEATRRKAARELIQAIGMTAVRAIYEDRLRDIEAKIYRRPGEDDDGLEDCPPDDVQALKDEK